MSESVKFMQLIIFIGLLVITDLLGFVRAVYQICAVGSQAKVLSQNN